MEKLSADLQREFPAVGGFSASNLWRMKAFFELYREDEKLAPVVREIAMQFYLATLDRQVRQQDENPFIGIILCKEKSRIIRRDYGVARGIIITHLTYTEDQLVEQPALQILTRDELLGSNGTLGRESRTYYIPSNRLNMNTNATTQTNFFDDPNSHQVDPNSHQVDPNSHQVDPNSHQVDPNTHQVLDTILIRFTIITLASMAVCATHRLSCWNQSSAITRIQRTTELLLMHHIAYRSTLYCHKHRFITE